ncbi:MAG: ABC transporter ATP-binding protein/permease [Caldilinea sp.]|nr:ABC transporter ATP-binding protein [Caldilineaceae bacterium]MCO5213146.1 ABC transporter ATP-binding protein/permease [Caldilinea sp.]MCB9117114.1 ABC transporter ATP-binding protein [Caldilineaceae bacterium]MCB9118837.1 ABC transporter ATP-binding protein [Caldilineaceae bacterium]MCB9124976.1 ABC transporter ATP-binding protein [Caldilineaceae bacterium]
MHGGNWWRYVSFDDSNKQRPTVDRQLLRRVFRYARPYLPAILIVLGAITLTSLLGLIPPLIYRALIDDVLPNGDLARLNLLAIGLFAVPLLSGLFGVVQRRYGARAGEGIIYDLRNQMFDHLGRMSMRFFTNTKSGEIVSRFNNDVVGAQNAITGTIPDILTNVITLVSTLIVMLSIEWRLALLSVAVLPLFLLPARRVGLVLRKIRRQALDYNADMSSQITETLTVNGALLMKTFSRLPDEERRFRDISAKVRDIGVRRAEVAQLFFMGLGLVGAIGGALVYWAGGLMVLNGALTIGTIVAFAAYLTRLYGPISALTNVQVEFVTALVSFERVFEYLDMPVEIQDKPGALELGTVDGRIRFDHVWFQYQGPLLDEVTEGDGEADENAAAGNGNGNGGAPAPAKARRHALQDVTFDIAPGTLTALVGPSGAGKTTITYLLPRLYDPTGGSITIDGHDLRDVTQESLAHQFGVVTQETFLFHDTIRANLLYARPDATPAQVETACKAANIHDMIAALPEGYDTLVGERGYRLSGGEKQRLAIARVILKDPRILVLDEATSHLDSQSEALIQAALEPLLQGRTSVVIAHRLSTILAADKILVVDKGQIVEQGTHRELLARQGLYATLYETQFRDQIAAAAELLEAAG